MKLASRKAGILLLVGSLFFSTLLAPSNAEAANWGHAKNYSVNARQHHQAHRIQQGVKNNKLTRREALRLAHQEKRLNKQEKRYRSDGEFTKWERAKLQREQNQLSRHIYRQKHDNQTRR